MRSNQQNKRSRGRGNNNNNRGKNSNPLSRNYESNGPDVRIRGNAATVAEKYMQLARDAHSSGDSVAAENYLQHAEHYNRIILAAQAQIQQQQQARAEQSGNQDQRQDNDSDEDDDNTPASRFDSPRRDDQDRPSNRGDNRRSNEGNRQSAGQKDDEAAEVNGAGTEANGKSAEEEVSATESKPRPARRPRRKRSDDEGTEPKSAANQAGSPQPSVGDLPAFVTGDGEVSAAE